MRTTSIEPAVVEQAVSVLVIEIRVSPPLHAVTFRKLSTLLGLEEVEVLSHKLLEVPVFDVPLAVAWALLKRLACTLTEKTSIMSSTQPAGAHAKLCGCMYNMQYVYTPK